MTRTPISVQRLIDVLQQSAKPDALVMYHGWGEGPHYLAVVNRGEAFPDFLVPVTKWASPSEARAS